MPTREDVREGIKTILREELDLGYEGQLLNEDEVTTSILQYLDSQGVVIKVDMGIKDHPAFQTEGQAMMYGYITEKCHLVAVESLIKEE